LEAEIDSLKEPEKELRRAQLARRETEFTRLRRVKLRESSFELLKRIGRGAFGEVWLVQLKGRRRLQRARSRVNDQCSGTTHVFAMKKMAKSYVVETGKAAHIRAERDAMAAGSTTVGSGDDLARSATTTFATTGAARAAATSATPWVVRLFYSFQDATHLFLVMEYVPGGDLMSMLCALDALPEDHARFYIAETLMALEAVHAMDYMHRDVKPDNLLIDATGHLKISG
jgi:serine/threonine protein kinase